MESLYCHDEVGRHIISCYEVTKVIIEHALKHMTQICVAITRIEGESKDYIVIPLNPTQHSELHSNNIAETNGPILLFKGITRSTNLMTVSKTQFIKKFWI